MALIPVKPFKQGGSSWCGISLSAGSTNAGFYFRLSISRGAQEKYFGGALKPGEEIALTVTDDPNHRQLMGIKRGPGIVLSGGTRHSVQCRVMAWRSITEKQQAAALPVVNPSVQGGGISVRLPGWAVPPAHVGPL